MKCPVDNAQMIVLEDNAIEIDYCAECGGLWLDEGELELLLGANDSDALLLTGGKPRPAPGERKRRCPVCRKKMLKEATGTEEPVTYDRCPRGHGLWLDAGELQAIVRAGDQKTDARIVALLQEMFPEASPKIMKEPGS